MMNRMFGLPAAGLEAAASGATAVALAQTVQHERLRHSLDAAEAERRRWARELHDETLQGLAALRVMLSTGLRQGTPDALEQAAREAVDHAASEVANLRRLITELRPAALDQLGQVVQFPMFGSIAEPTMQATADRGAEPVPAGQWSHFRGGPARCWASRTRRTAAISRGSHSSGSPEASSHACRNRVCSNRSEFCTAILEPTQRPTVARNPDERLLAENRSRGLDPDRVLAQLRADPVRHGVPVRGHAFGLGTVGFGFALSLLGFIELAAGKAAVERMNEVKAAAQTAASTIVSSFTGVYDMMANGAAYDVDEVGIFTPKAVPHTYKVLSRQGARWLTITTGVPSIARPNLP